MGLGLPPAAASGRFVRRCAVLAALLGVACGGAGAQTLDFAFPPPDMPTERICPALPPEIDLTIWDDWDGAALPDMPLSEIRAHVARMQSLDPMRWFDTVWRIADLLETTPEAEREAVLLQRVEALQLTGQFQRLAQSGYVAQLAEAAETLKAATRLALSAYLQDGIGIAPDPARADEILVAAGYGGYTKALWALAERQLAGTAPAEWVVPVELTIATAFTSIIGEMDPDICDRIEDVATAYRLGRLVTPDPQLAHDWYRFSADLGDARAAWRVVQYQTIAEGVEKDNAALLRYLEQAADAGLPYARTELARVLEAGALVPRDLVRARAILQQLADTGDEAGRTQLVLFLRRNVEDRPDWQPALRDAVEALLDLPEPPGLAFRDLAAWTLRDQGRWAGRDAALSLYQQGAALGDLESRVQHARLTLALSPDVHQVDAAVDVFADMFNLRGGRQPALDVVDSLVCRTPGPLDTALIRAWEAQVQNASGDLSAPVADSILDLTPDRHPYQIASLQAEAVFGTPTGVAEWRRYLGASETVDPRVKQYWEPSAEDSDTLFMAQARVDLGLSRSQQDTRAILAAIRDRHAASGPDFAFEFNPVVFEKTYGLTALADLDPPARAQAIAVLQASAARGHGGAIQMLAQQQATQAEQAALFERYRPVIEARGDFAAQIFAAGHAADPAPFLARAIGSMRCDFASAVTVIETAAAIGDLALLQDWMGRIEVLIDQPSQYRQLANLLLRFNLPNAQDRADALFAQAMALGDVASARLVLAAALRPTSPRYDIGSAAEMIATALAAQEDEVLAGYLLELSDADRGSQLLIAAQFDMEQLHRAAAARGHPLSMRLLGLFLRGTAQTPQGLSEAMGWLARAAQAGDTPAMVEYGQALAFGLGVPQDMQAALVWLQRAADGGSVRAQELARLVRLSQGA